MNKSNGRDRVKRGIVLRSFIFFILKIATVYTISAQNTINNLFVNSTENIVRLDFSSGDPQVSYAGFGSGASIGEGIAHVENASGEVILLVNSSGVYDRNGDKMPASEGVLAHPSSTEIVICRKPGTDRQYYIIYNNQLCSGLFYSVVDLSLRNGLGDVSDLNLVLDNQFSYAEGLEIVAIPCSNDFYLLSYRCYTGITRFRITTGGFSPGVLIQALNTGNHGGRGELDYHKGKFGYGITFTNQAFLGDFNATTGEITNTQMVSFSMTNGIYGLEFSPDATRVYVTDLDNRDFFGNVSSPNLFSYEFSTGLKSSWTLSNSGNTCNSSAAQGLGQIELGKDHNLYIPVVSGCKIYVVKNADSAPVVEFIETTSVLSTGMSDHIQSDFLGEYSTPDPRVTAEGDDYLLCTDEVISLNVSPATGLDYQWFRNDQILPGKTTSLLQVKEAGTYHVSVKDDKNCEQSSPSVLIGETILEPPDLGDDIILCEGSSIQFNAGQQGVSVTWSDGDTSPVKNISDPGLWTVTLEEGDCTFSDEVNINVLKVDLTTVPNVITPGLITLNDYFELPWDIAGLQLLILNRWGKQVYYSNDYQNTWNAENLGGGVYYYQVQSAYDCLNFKGWIHVIK